MIALGCILIIPLCGVCCIVAFCYENICKKRNILEESNYNDSNYKVIEV
jgi:hypothetical protein